MTIIWDQFLFRPLLNLLIALYNTVGANNLGWAIVWLTLLVSFLLLPLSLQNEKSRNKKHQLEKELAKVKRSYANNPGLLREKQRETLKAFRFRKWPKVIVLAVQGLVLVLLYQVFLGGIYVEKFVDQIYSFISIPENINTIFFGIDIAKRSFFLSFLSAAILFGNIWAGHRKAKKPWTRADLPYSIGFPLGTFFVLWYLPGVKALFIIGSQIFSNILRVLRAFKNSIKEQDAFMSKRSAAKDKEKEHLPQFRDRF